MLNKILTILVFCIAILFLTSLSISTFAQENSTESTETSNKTAETESTPPADDDFFMSEDDMKFTEESMENKKDVEVTNFTPDTYKTLEIGSYGEIILKDRVNREMVNQGLIVYKVNYKTTSEKDGIKKLDSIEIHDKYGMRSLIMIDDMGLIYKRVIMALNNKQEYTIIKYIEGYTNGVLTSREFFDKKNRPDHFIIYTYISNIIALERKDDYVYDDTYGYYGIDVTNKDDELIEKERFDSNGKRVYLKRYEEEDGKKIEKYYNTDAILVAIKYFDKDSKPTRQDYFNRKGELTGYRVYYYSEEGKKIKIVNFNKDGDMFEVLRYNNYGKIKAREKYKEGKLINTVSY